MAIVGAGPTGLTLSILLSQLGVKHAIFDRAAGITQHPQARRQAQLTTQIAHAHLGQAELQAHYINNRTMEVFRGLAAPGQASVASQVAQQAPLLDLWRKFVYCESMTGPIYGEVDHFKASPFRQPPDRLVAAALLGSWVAICKPGACKSKPEGPTAACCLSQSLWSCRVRSRQATLTPALRQSHTCLRAA